MNRLMQWTKQVWFWPVIVVVVLRIPTLFDQGGYADEGIYMALARAMHEGARLYVTIWDHKPPLLYGWYYAAWWLGSWQAALVAMKVAAMMWAVASLGLIWAVGQRLYDWPDKVWRVVLWGAVVWLATPLLEAQAANAELLFVPLNLLAIYSWLRWPGKWWIGAVAGLSLLTKASGGLEIGLVLCILSWYEAKDWRQWLGWMIRLGGGGAAVVAAAGVWVLIYSQPQAAWQAIWTYNQDYSAWAWRSLPLAGGWPWVAKAWAGLGVVAGVGVAVMAKRLGWSLSKTVVIGWLLASGVAATLSARLYGHYFLQMVPAMSLALGWGLEWVWSRTVLTRRHIYSGAGIVLVVAALGGGWWVSQGTRASQLWQLVWYDVNSGQRSQALAATINSQYSQDGLYYYYGDNAWVLSLTKPLFSNTYVVWYHHHFPDERVWQSVALAKMVVVELDSSGGPELSQALQASAQWRLDRHETDHDFFVRQE